MPSLKVARGIHARSSSPIILGKPKVPSGKPTRSLLPISRGRIAGISPDNSLFSTIAATSGVSQIDSESTYWGMGNRIGPVISAVFTYLGSRPGYECPYGPALCGHLILNHLDRIDDVAVRPKPVRHLSSKRGGDEVVLPVYLESDDVDGIVQVAVLNHVGPIEQLALGAGVALRTPYTLGALDAGVALRTPYTLGALDAGVALRTPYTLGALDAGVALGAWRSDRTFLGQQSSRQNQHRGQYQPLGMSGHFVSLRHENPPRDCLGGDN